MHRTWTSHLFHMVIYMFQCYSLKPSHPRLLPQSPKDCSLHLCLFCCLTYRVIITIFLNSMKVKAKVTQSCLTLRLHELYSPWNFLGQNTEVGSISLLQGHPSAPALCTLSHASNLDWRCVSHMIIYTFQHYPLKSSHPHLLSQSPKDCSLHLCLFCCLTSLPSF